MKIQDYYPFTKEEFSDWKAGVDVTPYAYTQLQSAVRMDCRFLLEDLSKTLKSPGEIDWLTGPLTREAVLARTRKALDYLISDLPWELAERGNISEPFAKNRLLDRAIDAALGDGDGDIDGDSLAKACHHVVSSIAALLLLGRVREGLELALLADSLAVIGNTGALHKDEAFEKGKSKSMSPHVSRLRMLRFLHLHLEHREIPTKKRLYSAMKMDPSQASPLVRDSGLQELLPDAKWRPNQFRHGEVYRIPKHEMPELKGFIESRPPLRESDISHSSSLNYDAPDRDIRLLREKWGLAFPSLLLMLGMDDLKEPSDLDEFQLRLNALGLVLDWGTIRNQNSPRSAGKLSPS